ncbi:hypothetical protein BDZ85DRAFT_286518 [Elsinoe ampelina]|uniref:Uncharacterized protein n=1 Tax=Elsinoe ampelina TaxID=302913 RepID=A0A6A6FXN6_9PEZI|nr:hypothetical protein BDZ85DRAFT_286518 [Elsinoe ampelina]
MHFSTTTAAILVAPALVLAAPQPQRGSSQTTCQKSPYRDLLPLSAYVPAMVYCSWRYPLPTKTTTTTVTVTPKSKPIRGRQRYVVPPQGGLASLVEREAEAEADAGRGKGDAFLRTWNSVLMNGRNFASTMCSCIETPVTRTRTITVTAAVTTTTKSAAVITTTAARTSQTSAVAPSTTALFNHHLYYDHHHNHHRSPNHYDHDYHNC